MRSKLRKIGVAIAILLTIPAVFLAYRAWGPHRSYEIDYTLPATPVAPGSLEAGVAMRDITPDLTLFDAWHDADGNSKFEPDKGDTFDDRNGNGEFDAVWLGGFNINRPAKAVNDPLWVRAIALRNNGVTIALVTIDSIGITHDAFIEARTRLDPALDIDHVLFATTHNHNTPDTMGIWSYGIVDYKFDHAYLERIVQSSVEAVEEAVRRLEPVDMTIAQTEIEPKGFVRDTRTPTVFDRKVCCAWFKRQGTPETLATIISWGNHPESLGGDNGVITSDFPHFLRFAMERGLSEPAGMEGFGGMCLFFQGSVGGLMTPLNLDVPERDGSVIHTEPTFGKPRALGENLALVAAAALRGENAIAQSNPPIAVAAKTIYAPMETLFKYAIFLGIVHPGWYWGKAKTEVNAIKIGDLEILGIPGELYPEIADGGVEAPDGGDYPGDPVEVPPLREAMQGKVEMVFNLANDEVGYIIPRTQWDTEPPYAYGRSEPQYGEENSGGPNIAGILHRTALELLERVHAVKFPAAESSP